MDNKFLKYENFVYDLEEKEEVVEEIEDYSVDNVVEPVFENYRVKVEVRKLNIRVAPGFNEIMIKKKLYKDQIVDIIYEQDGWGELKDGGWIKLEFTKKY